MTDKKTTSQNSNNLSHAEEMELMSYINGAANIAKRNRISVTGRDTENGWQTVRQKTVVLNEPRTKFKLSGFHYAAAAVLLIAVSFFYLFSSNKITIDAVNTRIVQLPEQTTVTLNSGSTLIYSSFLGWGNRTVNLTGEAYFEVTHTGKPFIVNTKNAQITVLGTKFNVNTSTVNGLPKTVVFLKEGKVSFAPKNEQEEAVILQPGELSVISEEQPLPLQPKMADQTKALDWLQKRLSFIDQPIAAIFEMLENRYDVQIEVKVKEALKQSLTIYISNPQSIEQTLGDICQAAGLKYKHDGHTFTILNN